MARSMFNISLQELWFLNTKSFLNCVNNYGVIFYMHLNDVLSNSLHNLLPPAAKKQNCPWVSQSLSHWSQISMVLVCLGWTVLIMTLSAVELSVWMGFHFWMSKFSNLGNIENPATAWLKYNFLDEKRYPTALLCAFDQLMKNSCTSLVSKLTNAMQFIFKTW